MDEHAAIIGKTFVWHECVTRDSAAASKFYSDLLGWTTSTMPMPDGEYTMFHNMGMPVAGCFTMGGPQFEGVPAHWAIYIAVEDVDATVAKAVSMGATNVVAAFDVPDIGRMALLCDPTEAHFWVYKPAGS